MHREHSSYAPRHDLICVADAHVCVVRMQMDDTSFSGKTKNTHSLLSLFHYGNSLDSTKSDICTICRTNKITTQQNMTEKKKIIHPVNIDNRTEIVHKR